MRIIIYGAGAVGGVVGGLLALSGTPVVMVGRPQNVAAIRENGLKLITPVGTHIVQLAAVTSPDQIEFSRMMWFFSASRPGYRQRDARPVCPGKGCPCFCFQNGVRNEEIVSKYYPRVYGVMVKAGAVFIRDGEVESRGNPPGRFVLGRYPDGNGCISRNCRRQAAQCRI